MWDCDINNHELAVVKETLGSHEMLETLGLVISLGLSGVPSVLEKIIFDKKYGRIKNLHCDILKSFVKVGPVPRHLTLPRHQKRGGRMEN